MIFQTRLFLQLLAITLAFVTIFAYSVIRYTETAFEEMEAQREQRRGCPPSGEHSQTRN